VTGYHIILREHWCNVAVLNVHAPWEDKSNDTKNSFYEESGCAFDQFPRYDTKIMFSDFNTKVGREDIFKSTIGNKTSDKISNDNGVRVVNLASSKKRLSKASSSLTVTFSNTRGPPLNERHTTRLITVSQIREDIQVYLMSDLSEGLTVILTTILIVAKFRERPAVSKQVAQKMDTER
jgi:hypothetical protein